MWNQLLKDRVAFVSGAASGVGRASSIMFARHGAKVVVADIDDVQGNRTLEMIHDKGGEAMFVHADVSSDSSVSTAVDAMLDRFGTVDILYNNAAATQLCNEHDRAAHELSEKVWDKIIDVTLKSVYLCSKYCLPAMLKKKKGVILNTTSIDAFLPEAGFDSYAAAKGGVISLTKAMAVNYGKQGIRVNCISPGYVITEVQMGWYTSNPEMVKAVEANHLTRLGQPDDVANMATFLVSDLAEFITGAIIPVDGGYQIYKPSRADEFCRDKSL